MNSNLSWYEEEYLDEDTASFTKIARKKSTKQSKESAIKRKQKEKLRQKEQQIHSQDKIFD